MFSSCMEFVLNFSWSFRKNWKKSFMAFQCPGCDKTYSSCIDFVLEFSWSFSKNWKKPFIAFQCPGCDTMFSSFIDFVLDFLWSFRKNWKKPLMAFQCLEILSFILYWSKRKRYHDFEQNQSLDGVEGKMSPLKCIMKQRWQRWFEWFLSFFSL